MTGPLLRDFAAEQGFPLDDFQVEACLAVEGGQGVLVAAPTGAGKTIVGEFAVHAARRLHALRDPGVAARFPPTATEGDAP